MDKKTYGQHHAEDNWKHRNTNMKCGTCMWFAIKAKTAHPIMVDKETIDKLIKNGIPTGGVEDCSIKVMPPQLGRCRKHAPTMNGFPAVFDTDWCGDHKLDENKI